MNIRKISLFVGTALAVVGLALGSTGVVQAQSDGPAALVEQNNYGFGDRGAGMDGPMHDYMITYIAEQLGLSVEEIETRLANGETLSTIALSTGMTFEEFTTLMKDARGQAIDQAVADGALTQAQADWMKSRGSFMGGNNSMMRRGGGRFNTGSGSCLGLQ